MCEIKKTGRQPAERPTPLHGTEPSAASVIEAQGRLRALSPCSTNMAANRPSELWWSSEGAAGVSVHFCAGISDGKKLSRLSRGDCNIPAEQQQEYSERCLQLGCATAPALL